jgi:hypothetical protein
VRGFTSQRELYGIRAVREWEAKFAPLITEELRPSTLRPPASRDGFRQ